MPLRDDKMRRYAISDKPDRVAVGLMSGTSVDGVDAAVIRIEGEAPNIRVTLLAFENKAFPEAVRNEILDCFIPRNAIVTRLGRLNFLLGELFAEAALSVIRAAGLSPADVDVIGSHGQTIWHEPNPQKSCAYTVQLGEGSVIAQRTGVVCISDFRVSDMAAGGQGAPLVPFTEFLLYRSEKETTLLQNLGGIGNITVLPKGCGADDVYAFDTGPGNMVIDALVSRSTNGLLTMDKGGSIAAKGQVDFWLLQFLLQHPYFSQLPPKTTGREVFGKEYTDALIATAQQKGIPMENVISTATAMTAASIAQAYRDFILPCNPASRMILSGGGCYNPILVDFIRKEFVRFGVDVRTQEEAGGNSDAKEAIAFALLADCTLHGIPGNLPAVTGAKNSALLGKISLPPKGGII